MQVERELVSQGIPVVREVSKRIARHLGGRVALEDLHGIGNLALVEVARSFDPARASFTAYAGSRLRFLILDGVRRETHGRSVRARVTALLASERMSEAAAEEPERAAPTTLEQDQQGFAALLADRAAALALGLLASPRDPELSPELGSTPEEAMSRAELSWLARRSVQALPELQRDLLERHYYGGEQFDTIARDLGITKSRACRLHQKAIQALKGAFHGPGDREEASAP